MNDHVDAQFLIIEVIEQDEWRLSDRVGADAEDRILARRGVMNEKVFDGMEYARLLISDDASAEFRQPLLQESGELRVEGA